VQVQVKSFSSAEKAKITVSKEVFGAEFNEPLVHQVVTTYLTNARQGSRAQKNRSAVSGGGAKPWKQKGTGRARAGTSRSPIWVKGGVTFAASPKKYDVKLNRKMYRVAIRSILSQLVRDNRLQVIEPVALKTPKTKAFVALMAKAKIETHRTLIIVNEITDNLYRSSRNIPTLNVVDVDHIDPVSLLSYHAILVEKEAVKALEEKFS